MKIKFLTILFLGSAILFCKADPRLVRSGETLKQNGVQYRKISSHFYFQESELIYHYLLTPDNRLYNKKWGDFELGLYHGRIQNGSWCMWNFFFCIMPDKKDLVRRNPAEKVCLLTTSSGVHAEIVWPDLTLKLIQLNGVKGWMFMEALVKDTPASLRLRAWPGGAKGKKDGGGLRRLMTLTQDETIPSKNMTFSEPSGGLALYNRNYSERNGNFLVFEPEKYAKTNISANNVVVLEFVPKAGEKVFHFALGYFLNEEPQESCGRFLRERLPNIVSTLKQIPWVPEADFSEFSDNIAVIEKILAKAALPPEQKIIFEAELCQCKERFHKAEKEKDIPSAYQEIEVSKQLRSRIGLEAVKSFR